MASAAAVAGPARPAPARAASVERQDDRLVIGGLQLRVHRDIADRGFRFSLTKMKSQQ